MFSEPCAEPFVLSLRQDFSDSLSGTTAIVAYFERTAVWVANVGDSRAIVGKLSHGVLKATPLSTDQTPFRKDERERIRAAGTCGLTRTRCKTWTPRELLAPGPIHALQYPLAASSAMLLTETAIAGACSGGEIMSVDQREGIVPMHDNWDIDLGVETDTDGDPPRVWVPNKDKPGCAFTRSIGDATGERVGVISDPELTKKEIKEHDKVSCEGGAQLIAYTRVCTVS